MEEKIKNISIELETGYIYLEGVSGKILSISINDLKPEHQEVFNTCVGLLLNEI